jgi:hypothetical protein
MRRAAWILALACVAGSAPARADAPAWLQPYAGSDRAPHRSSNPEPPEVVSPIAYPTVGGTETPRLFAQRAITREWGPSDDSVYVVVHVPEWRSEGGAMAMSAILPGSGELYVGERSGFLFLLAEVAGWTGYLVFKQRADDRRAEAHDYAGNPNDPQSPWSFERWAEATQEDATALEQIYASDPNAFYRLIGEDAQYAAGWSGADTRGVFDSLQRSADRRRTASRLAAGGLWLNHVISAVDALRAARIHNLPLSRNIQLRLKPSWNGDAAGWSAALEGSF